MVSKIMKFVSNSVQGMNVARKEPKASPFSEVFVLKATAVFLNSFIKLQL